MDRRTYLTEFAVTGASVAIAGCSNPVTDSDSEAVRSTPTPRPFSYVEDPWAEFSTTSEITSESASGKGTLQPGEYTYWRVSTGNEPTLSYTVEVDNRNVIDVLPMSGPVFGLYEQRRDVTYYEDSAVFGVTEDSKTSEIEAGVPHIVFDNTAEFGSEPDSEVTFEFEASVSWVET